MEEQLVFNRKQNKWIVWCIDHISSIQFNESMSGMLQDPFTKQNLCGVFYFSAPKIVTLFIATTMLLLWNQDATNNRNKCLKYGLIERNI